MNFLLRIATALALSLALGSAVASAETAAATRAWESWSRGVQAYEEELLGFQRALADYEALVQQVDRAKVEVLLPGREGRRLQVLLREAHDAGQALTERDQRLRRQRDVLEGQRRDVLRVARDAAQTCEGRPPEVQACVERWVTRIERLTLPLRVHEMAPVEEILRVPLQTPEQVRAAVDELRDVEQEVERALAELQESMRAERVRDRVHGRAREWGQDELLFQEGAVARRGRASGTRGGAEERPASGSPASPPRGSEAGDRGAMDDGAGQAGEPPSAAPEASPPTSGDAAEGDFDSGWTPPVFVEPSDRAPGVGGVVSPPGEGPAARPSVIPGDDPRASGRVGASSESVGPPRTRREALRDQQRLLEERLQEVQRERRRLERLATELEGAERRR